MANQITDNRTLVHAADAVTPYDDLAGSGAGTLDTEIFIQGTGSIGQYITSTRTGILYDAGSAQDWSGNVFYLWINCGIVGLLDTKANGGLTIRFCGNTVTDWFEVYVAGSDSWPNAIQGGWTQFVVDIDEARSQAVTNGWTNGTAPVTTAIRYVGYSAVTATAMPRMVDNTWLDEIRRLPANTPGIIVEGRNGGTTPWDSADIYAQLGDAVGTFIPSAGGAWKINTPIQFGINDTTTHEFLDTTAVWLWDNAEFVPDDVYRISALGNGGGTTNVTMGSKSGTGDAAVGSQGLFISSASDGPRWSMDFDDPDVDLVGLYGCTFVHGNDFQLDDPAVSCISTTFLDCVSAVLTGITDFLRCSVVAAATADGVAFATTDDLTDIVFSSFTFSDGHAIELTTPRVATQTSKGNSFSGYGAIGTNDAAIYNNTAGAVTINVTEQGDTPTYRNGTSASTTVNNAVTLTVNVEDQDGNAVNLAQVAIYDSGDTQLMNEDTTIAGVATESYAYTGDEPITIRVRKTSSGSTRYLPVEATGTITSAGFSTTITLIEDTIASA